MTEIFVLSVTSVPTEQCVLQKPVLNRGKQVCLVAVPVMTTEVYMCAG